MQRVAFLLLFLVSTSVVAYDGPQSLQDAFMKALRANDANGLAACYSADATNYPVDSMVGKGPNSVRKSWLGFFARYHVLAAELSATHMEVLGNTAIAWGLFKITAMPTEGHESIEMRGRYMDVSKNMDGNWLYIADHASLPVPPPAEE